MRSGLDVAIGDGVAFTDERTQLFDQARHLGGVGRRALDQQFLALGPDADIEEVFGPLQDLAAFNAVELDTSFGTIQWPNGADFDPETLHAWPKYRDEIVAMARRWATTSEPAHPTAG